jgi:hypothetical protein
MVAPNLKSDLNQRLQLEEGSSARGHYSSVICRLIYWKDADAGFHSEAQDLGRFFLHDMRYDVDYFAIPSASSFLKMLSFISDCLCAVNEQSAKSKGPVLLILHYGGHGDADDDRHEGEEERSVWAAYEAPHSCKYII